MYHVDKCIVDQYNVLCKEAKDRIGALPKSTGYAGATKTDGYFKVHHLYFPTESAHQMFCDAVESETLRMANVKRLENIFHGLADMARRWDKGVLGISVCILINHPEGYNLQHFVACAMTRGLNELQMARVEAFIKTH